MMPPLHFHMIGGFLGAGKTTTIARLARHYIDQGLGVGVVTNDQAFDLVDTRSLRAQGFRVGEVPGACFCCKFNDLIDSVEILREADRPDIILTEPVGSCTDLVATVLEPMRRMYDQEFTTGQYVVLLKPEHGQKILRNESGSGFSAKAAYIFLKQLEEADVVAISKADKLQPDDVEELRLLVAARFPTKPCLAMSARTGSGFERLVEALERPVQDRGSMMHVDYDTYAEGEAELGWLNATYELAFPHLDRPRLDDVAKEFVKQMRKNLAIRSAEPAHLKVLVQDPEGGAALANLVGSETEVDLSMSSGGVADHLEMTVNARVAMEPEDLKQAVESVLQALLASLSGESTERHLQTFRPGRPEPTHRVR